MKKNSIIKTVMLSIAILIVLIGNTLAATIISGEKSNDNDEYDQEMEIDEENKEDEENSTTKQKIQSTIDSQLEDMKNSAKSEVYIVLYNNSENIRGKIKELWKQSNNSDIADESLDKIVNKYENTLIEYSDTKLDEWFNTYKTNNRTGMIQVIDNYIDGQEDEIDSAVSIVVYTATESINSEINKICTKALEQIPDNVKSILDAYTKMSNYEERETEQILLDNDTRIKNILQEAFNSKFDWEDKKLAEAYSQIPTVSTSISNNFADKTLDVINSNLAQKLGVDPNISNLNSTLKQYSLKAYTEKMQSMWKELIEAGKKKYLTAAQQEAYKKIYEKVYDEKIKGEYKDKAILAEFAANEAAKNQIKDENFSEYFAQLKENQEAIENQFMSEIDEIPESLKDQAKAGFQEICGSLKTSNILYEKESTELDKEYDEKNRQLEIKYGKTLSDELIAEKKERIDNENKIYNNKVAKIDEKYPTKLTDEQKQENEANKTRIKTEAYAEEYKVLSDFGQKLSPTEKEQHENNMKTIENNYNTMKEEYKELFNNEKITEDEYKAKLKEIKATKDSEIKQENERVLPKQLSDEEKQQMNSKIDEIHKKRDEALDVEEARVDSLTISTKEQRDARKNELNDAKKERDTNIENIKNDSKYSTEQTEEQKQQMEAEKKALKEEKAKKEQEIKDKIKKEKQEKQAQNAEAIEKQKEAWNQYYAYVNDTYEPKLKELKEKRNDPNLTKEEKAEIDKQINDLKNEKANLRAALQAQDEKIRIKERELLSKTESAVLGYLENAVGELANSFAGKYLDKLTDKMTQWADKLGTLGQSVVRSVMSRVDSWLTSNFTYNVVQLFDKVFGKITGNTLTPNYKWEQIRIDWRQLGKDILFGWASSNEKLANILSGVGGVTGGVTTYERLALLNYTFISKGRTLFPTDSFVSAISVANKYAGQSKSIGDYGKIYSDTFGIKELAGYDIRQFLPMGSTTIFLNLPPFILKDTTVMSPGLSMITPRHVKYIFSIFKKNVTEAEVYPNGRRILSLPIASGFNTKDISEASCFDSAYVSTEFGSNFGNDSFVQRAFSYTSLAVRQLGVPFSPTEYSNALLKEALKYTEFALKVSAALGYQNTLKNLTDDTKLKTRYLDSRDEFIVGPFKVDYEKSRVETEARGIKDFGMMVDMQIFYLDTETGKEKEIPKGTWSILFSENGDIDYGYSDSRQSEDYVFPYPKEEFYIALDKSANPDVTNISKIKMKFKELQTVMYGYYSNIFYYMIENTALTTPIPTSTGKTVYLERLMRYRSKSNVVKNALFSVLYAKRYYMNWHMEINLNKKVNTTPAYETADYTTSYSIKSEGADTDSSVLYGNEINSSLCNSIDKIVKNYTEDNLDKYNTSSSTFTESLAKVSGIYTNASGDTAYVKGLNTILKAISENDATASLSVLSNLVSGNNNTDFQKVAKISKLVSESEKMRDVATLIDTLVEIYKNENDNAGMLILELLNETSKIYENVDFSKIMDSVNQLANNCEYKLPMFGITALSLNGEVSNSQMEEFMRNNYPEIGDDQKELVKSYAKSIISILSNSGDNGKIILQIISNAYKQYNGNTVISDTVKNIVDSLNDNDLKTEYRKLENILQINNKLEQINNDTTLSENEKQKQIYQEQIKLFKATSVAAKEINNGSNLTDAIQRAYGESSNIEKQILSKYQTVIKNLSLEETEMFTSNLIKAKNVENVLDVTNAELTRVSLKGEDEKPKRFVDIMQENSVLYDRTAYSEYDPQFNIAKVERPTDVYYMGDNKVDLTMTIAGVVWKDGHTGLQNDYDGVRTANTNGNIEKGVEGVKVTLIDSKTNQVGRMKVNGKWTEAVTYTDEGGYYHLEKVESSQYYVQFTYDGQKYMATTQLSDGEKRLTTANYKKYPDLEVYDNNSKAAENEEERIAFNDKFYDIREGTAYSREGEPLKVNGTQVGLQYEEENGTSSLITLDSEGHVLPQFAMTASTKELGITYPIDSEVTLDNESTETLTSQYLNPGLVYGEYKKTGEYMYHVNLGLVERSKLDLAVTQDVYKVDTTVNEKQETYSYNKRGDLAIYDAKLKNTDEYKQTEYTRELYNADYQLRLEDYQSNSLNKLDKYEKDKSVELENIRKVKEDQYNDGSLEERVFVTYKITLKNQSILQSGIINEITDYFDSTYKLVDNDLYLNIQNSEGIAERKLVAKQSYFIVQSDNSATEYKLDWEQKGMVNGLKAMNTVKRNNIGLTDVILRAGDEIYVFVTFEVDNGADEDESSRAIALGKKENIVEISSYTSIEAGETSKEHSLGLIDKDSAPDNLSVGERNTYEDDTDYAPVIELKLYSTDLRNIDGYTWDDDRTIKLSTGQVVGNGIREENEDLINGVRVQLIEKITGKDDSGNLTEYEYVWKEMFTGENSYKYIGSSGRANNSERGQTVSTGDIVSDTDLGATKQGEYKFHDYIAGNFIVRFIYGDTYKTYLADDSENTEGQGENKTSYNGEDYKSTAYLKGNNLYAKWYDLSGFDKDDKLYSDAKDDSGRRITVRDYTRTIQNNNAEVLASFDNRDKNKVNNEDYKGKYYYNTKLHQQLRDNTWMFADTAKINVNVEYNTTKSNGDANKEYQYRIKNIDFGLEKRPETRLELTKEITDITIKLASGDTLINTAAGMTQNVNWVANKKTEVKGNNYKRDNLKYNYRQGQIHIYMDEEVMQGAQIQISYKITVTNKGEIDYMGKDGGLGYTYYTGQVSSDDVIVTTSVDKIIDYVDNSLAFRKDDNADWSLIERMSEFTKASDVQGETTRMDYAEFVSTLQKLYGKSKVQKYTRELNAMYEYYKQTGKIQELGKTTTTNTNNTEVNVLSNTKVIQNMKDRSSGKAYLNEDLEMVKTKSAKTTREPITQIIVTKALENTKLKPGENATVNLVLSKTISPNDDDDTLNYGNMAEILQYTNTAGRRDMDAIPGNQEPDEEPYEYDTDFTERVLITPPTGANKAYYFVLAGVVLVILAGGIIVIKKKVVGRK